MKELNRQEVSNVSGGFISTAPFFTSISKTIDWVPNTFSKLIMTFSQSVTELFSGTGGNGKSGSS